VIRAALPEDAPFVASGFLRSFRGSPWAGAIPSEMYWDSYGKAYTIAASRPGMRTLVAVVAGVLVGFVTGRPPDVLVYVYVKSDPVDYRRGGIMTALLDALGIERGPGHRIRCVFWTYDWRDVLRKTGWRADYVPGVVWRAPKQREKESHAEAG